jgi:hypothetical protein
VKLPSREKRELALKLLATLALETAIAPPILALTVCLGRAPERVLALQNALRQRALLWMFPYARPRK